MIPDPDSVVGTNKNGEDILARQLTCYCCIFRDRCKYSDHPDNTNGYCLSIKK